MRHKCNEIRTRIILESSRDQRVVSQETLLHSYFLFEACSTRLPQAATVPDLFNARVRAVDTTTDYIMSL